MVLALFALFLPAACGRDARPQPEPSPPVSEGTIDLFYSLTSDDCAAVVAVQRESGAEPTLAGAMEALLAGPTPEEQAQGVNSLFGDATKDQLISAEIEDGVARIDFRDLREVIPNASSSCGSMALLAQLDNTAGPFGVEKTLYSINGDLNTFYEWLQLTAPDA